MMSQPKLKICIWQRTEILMLMAVVFCALAPALNAAIYTWAGTAGTEQPWETGGNWDLGSAPAGTDTVYIQNWGTALVTTAVTCSNLYIGYSGANGGGLIISNGATYF